MDLVKAGRIQIIRHVKIRAKANPFDPDWINYFIERRNNKRTRINQDSRFVEE